VALPSFESYARAHNKVGFSRLASELDLPQPTTQFVSTAEELHRIETFPYVLKGAVGTASRSIWMINNRKDMQRRSMNSNEMAHSPSPFSFRSLKLGPLNMHRPYSAKERSLASMGIGNSAVALAVVTPPRSVYFAQRSVRISPVWESI
jgi:hypothetical protein